MQESSNTYNHFGSYASPILHAIDEQNNQIHTLMLQLQAETNARCSDELFLCLQKRGIHLAMLMEWRISDEGKVCIEQYFQHWNEIITRYEQNDVYVSTVLNSWLNTTAQLIRNKQQKKSVLLYQRGYHG